MRSFVNVWAVTKEIMTDPVVQITALVFTLTVLVLKA